MRKSPRLPPEQLAPYVLECAPLPEGQSPTALDWPTLFGNAQPVEIEVGFGKGLFLLTESQARPDTNFLGIEIARKYYLFSATRIARRERTNVRLVCGDARSFLQDRVADNSVQRVHVYFPDPWWKKRHHKRRVFTGEFAASCTRILVPGGELLVATDVEDYATMVRETVAAHTPLQPTPPPQAHDPAHDMDYLTNFERRFRRQGKTIHRLAYRK